MLRPLKRVPAPVLALALALAPGLTWALGLGGIRSDSALNEPFLGRIELNGIAPEELDAVQVTLASEAEFTKAGSPRPHFLSRLTFTPEVSPEGRLQIRVTSPEPIREPYLDFLVEVTWPQGRLVKGYTVLLDPPTTLNRPPPAVRAPQVSAPGARGSRSEDEPLRAGGAAPPSGISTAAGLPTTPAIRTGAGLTGPGQTTNEIGPAPAAPPPAFGPSPPGYPLRYGPVPSGATLTTLARRMAPAGASREQTALAIFRANPHAFSGGDINRLKAGVRLEISHPDLIFALDAKAARQYYLAAQKGLALPPLPGPTLAPVTASALEPSALTSASGPDRLAIATRHPAAEEGSRPAGEAANGSPTLTAASVPSTSPATDLDSAPAHAASPATGMVTGVPPEMTSEGPLGPDLALVEREVLLVREMAETGRQETTELRGRIDRLEAHLGDIKRLLELSNAHLAELQRLGIDARLGDEGRAPGEERVAGERASLPSAPVVTTEPSAMDAAGAKPAYPEALVSETQTTVEPEPTVREAIALEPLTQEASSPEAGASATAESFRPPAVVESSGSPARAEPPLPSAAAEPASPPVATEPVAPPVEQMAPPAREPVKPGSSPTPPKASPPPPTPEPSLYDDLSGWTLVVAGPLLVLLLGLLVLVRRQNQVKPGPEVALETTPPVTPAHAPELGLDQSSLPPAAPGTVPSGATDGAVPPVKRGGPRDQLSHWRTRSSEWLGRSGGLKLRWFPRRTSDAVPPAKVGGLKRLLSRERPTATAIELPTKQGWLQQQLTRWRRGKAESSSASAGWRGQLPQWVARFRKAPPPIAIEGVPTGEVTPMPMPLQALAAPVPLAGHAPLEPIHAPGAESAKEREQPPAPPPLPSPPAAPQPTTPPLLASPPPAPQPSAPPPSASLSLAPQSQSSPPQAQPVMGETSTLATPAETREVLSLSLPPLPGALDLSGPPSESPVRAAGALALEVDQDIALEEAALAALDQTLREPEPSPIAAQPLPPRPGELDLGDILELPPLAPIPGGPNPPPQSSAEVPELDLSDLEGLDLGEALGLTPAPAPSPAAGAGGEAGPAGDRESAASRAPVMPEPAMMIAGRGEPAMPGGRHAQAPPSPPLADTTGHGDGLSLGEMAGLAGLPPLISAAVSAPSGQPSADLGLELDLSDLLDLDLDLSVLSAPEAGSAPKSEAGDEYGATDAGLELHLPKPSVETPPSWSLPSERAGVAGETGLAPDFDQEPEIWDEVGIKLDLARAYLQMDDPEASRGILKEILVEGTEEQIAQAKALLARLE